MLQSGELGPRIAQKPVAATAARPLGRTTRQLPVQRDFLECAYQRLLQLSIHSAEDVIGLLA